MKIIEGRAGTGKSFTLQAVRDAFERSGRDVIGLAPTNAVAQDLRTEGKFSRAATVHSELFRIKNGLASWDRGSVVIVDEAAMLDSRVTGELFAEAKRASAKIILAGDDRQLASIERGGLFSELKARHGSVAITEVTRQKVDWQRQAARDLAEGRFEEALVAFARGKAVTWTTKQDEARISIVERWKQDTAAAPEKSRFVFAYTNKDVDRLNAALRQVRIDRDELGADHRFETKHGVHAFAVGDRVQFTDTLKGARIYNGNAGTITAIDDNTGMIRARLDASPGSEGREVIWSASEFAGFRHGYAGTIYKGQGKTLDQTYLLHTHHWRQASSYVALTRQRERAQIFVATETARDLRQLARQMSRQEIKTASVAYATIDELTPMQKANASQEDRQLPQPKSAPLKPLRVRDILIPAFVSADGRDSLGRGLDEASVRAAVSVDPRVVQERRDQSAYISSAYRNTESARERLDELVRRDGSLSAARRIASEPSSIGELQGRTGLFAGAAGKAERARAETVVAALAENVRRVGEAESAAEQNYRKGVQAQRAADAVVIPKLSRDAQVVLTAIASTPQREQKVVTYERASPKIREEFGRFVSAMQWRFGDGSLRGSMRSEAVDHVVRPNSVGNGEHGAFRGAMEIVRTVKGAERAAQAVQAESVIAKNEHSLRVRP